MQAQVEGNHHLELSPLTHQAVELARDRIELAAAGQHPQWLGSSTGTYTCAGACAAAVVAVH